MITVSSLARSLVSFRPASLATSTLAALMIPASASAQEWQPTGGPFGGPFQSVELSPLHSGLALAGGGYGRATRRSEDGGRRWEDVTGLSSPGLEFAFDPVDPLRAYAGTWSGVFKTTDGGRSWRQLEWAPSFAFEIAVDPGDADRMFVIAGLVGFPKLRRSEDAGRTWTSLGLSGSIDQDEILVLPGTGTVLLTLPSGSYRSTDGGNTFDRTLDGLVGPLAHCSAQPDVVMLATRQGIPARVWRSVDEGASWTEVSAPVLDAEVASLAVDPLDPSRAPLGTVVHGVWSTIDGGTSWTPVHGVPLSATITSLRFAPWDPAVVLAASKAGLGIYRSADGGASLEASSVGAYEAVVRLRSDPGAPGAMWAVGHRRIYRRGTSTGHWDAFDTGTPDAGGPTTDLAIDPLDPDTLLVGDSVRPTIRESTDGGASWQNLPGPFGTSGLAALRFGSSGVLYAAANYAYSFARSLDGGQSWIVRDAPFVLYGELEVDPLQSARIHVAGDTGYWRSVDGGDTWSSATSGLAYAAHRDLAVDATDPERVYIVSDLTSSGTGATGFHASEDGGATWTNLGQGLEEVWLSAVAVDPFVPERIVVGGWRGVFVSEDRGASFTPLLGGLDIGTRSVLDLRFDPQRPGLVYLSEERDGVFTYDFGCPEPAAYCDAKTNSLGLDAELRWTGSPSVASADFALTISAAVPDQIAIVFHSTSGPAATPFFGGVLCAEPPLERLPPVRLDGTGSATIPVGIDASMVGTTRWHQCLYRDPAHSDGTGLALTDGLAVVFCE